MSQQLQRSTSSPATIPLRPSEKSSSTTTFMLQPTSDWVFFPQPSFSDMNDDEDDDEVEGGEDEDELENRRRIHEERNGWVTALWGRIFRAKEFERRLFG